MINEIKERTGVTPVALNCMQLSREDVSRIMKKILDSSLTDNASIITTFNL